MLEITRDHIQKLNDTDLRALIGYLCEADVSSKGLPTSCVTWGGKQTAADGGLDVRVDISKKRVDNGYIPKPKTGFQVKKHTLQFCRFCESKLTKDFLAKTFPEAAPAACCRRKGCPFLYIQAFDKNVVLAHQPVLMS